jgi:hypothetical protein
MPRRQPFPPSSDKEPSLIVKRAVIANINEVVAGGILRAGKREYGDNWTGWWLGLDSDGNPKLDITFDDDTYIRFSQAGIQISADGGALTGIDGAAIVAGSITGTQIAGSAIATEHLAANAVTADKIAVTNLAAVAVTTGALTVNDTLTMGEDGLVTWASGDAKITEDYIDFLLQANETQAIRWIDGSSTVLAHVAAYSTAALTQLGIMARGPSVNKYGTIALSVADSTEENTIADLSLNSDDGCHINVSSAKSGAIIKCSGTVLVSSKIQHGIQGSESWTTGVTGTDWRVAQGADLTTTPRLTVEAGGEVGIGTTAPGFQLHLYSATGGGTQACLECGDSLGNLFEMRNADQRWSMGVNSAESFVIRDITNSNAQPLTIYKTATANTLVLRGGKVGIMATNPGSLLELNLATEDLEIVNAGSAGATEQDWIEVQVGGVTGYIRVYAGK